MSLRAWLWKTARAAFALIAFLVAGVARAQMPKPAVGGAIHAHERMPLDDFYDNVSPLPPAPPGTLIRSEQFDDYSLSSGISVTRLMYHSRSSSGEDVAVSGVVLVPDGKAPAGGRPIIAWAHGFQGVARQCAPSLLQNLGEGSYFSMYVKLGYVVVATDFAGLGTRSQAAYLNARSNGLDVIYSVAAARSAIHDLGPRWMVMGEREGGVVAIAVAEMESQFRDVNFLGSIALGGLIDSENIVKQGTQGDAVQMIYVAYGIKSAFPQFALSEMLTSEGIAFYQKAIPSCYGTGELPLMTVSHILHPNWQDNWLLKRYLEINTLGRVIAYRPLLVLASDRDSSRPIAMTAETVARLCRQEDRVVFYTLHTGDPKTLMGDSVNDQIAWIQGRFANQAAPGNCNAN